MKGFVLAYRNEDLIKALSKAGATDIKSGKISYVDTKQDLSDMIEIFLSSGTLPKVKKASLLFSKDKSWEEEHEYRIITESAFLPREGLLEPVGMCINGVVPYQIGIGYRMEKDTQDKVVEYAEKHGIEVRQYTPDFRDKRNDAFINEIIVKGLKTRFKKAMMLTKNEKTSSDEMKETEMDDKTPEELAEWEKLIEDVYKKEKYSRSNTEMV